ncbi:MAG: DUF5320 domain-containing protein [Kiritimatiellia bacterium]
MPGGDGTGPGGIGPMTGRAAGYCAGYGMPGYANPVPGRGFGYGRGRGFGYGRGMGPGFRGGRGRWGAYTGPYGYGAPAVPYYGGGYVPQYGYGAQNPEDELNALKGQSEYLEEALEGVRRRISELESEGKGEKS